MNNTKWTRTSRGRPRMGWRAAGLLLITLFMVWSGPALESAPVQAGRGDASTPGLAARAATGDRRAAPPAVADNARDAALTATSVFTFALAADAVGLDPALTDGDSFLVTRQVYETLVECEPGGTIATPGLAESWSTSSDGLTWTFSLRPGLTFQDGTALDAAAVLFNLHRWWDPANPYHDGSFQYFDGAFGGFRGDPNCLITGLAISGTDQVQIGLRQPHSDLPSILTFPAFAIASPAAIQAGTLITTPVGSGPFRFLAWMPADHIRLAAADDYWGSRPLLDTLVFQVVPDDAARFAALQSNDVQGMGSVPWSYVPTATLDTNLQVVWRPALNIGYLGINRNHPPLDNLLVRQAIAHAIDKPSLLSTYYNSAAEVGEVAVQLLPPLLWGHDPDLPDYAYDPALARSLLSQAGYPDGFTTTLWVLPVTRTYLPQAAAMAADMQADLQAVGISATLEASYDWSTYLDKVFNGEADLFMLGWYGDWGHPDDFFYPLLCEHYLAYGPPDNQLCTTLEVARDLYDFDTLVDIYQWASGRVHDTLPLVPVAHVRTPLLLRSNVDGFVPEAAQPESFARVHFPWRVYLPLVVQSPGAER